MKLNSCMRFVAVRFCPDARRFVHVPPGPALSKLTKREFSDLIELILACARGRTASRSAHFDAANDDSASADREAA